MQQQSSSGAPGQNNEVLVIDDSSSGTGGAPNSNNNNSKNNNNNNNKSNNNNGQPSTAPRDIPLEMLEKSLENACETLASLATNVIDFSFDSQHVLFSKVNEFVRDLREIDQRGKHVNASIPMDVIEIIDKGRNPELCTFQMLESCAEASNVVRGKLSAVQQFRDELEKSVQEARSQGNLQPVKEDEVMSELQTTMNDSNMNNENNNNNANVNPNVPSGSNAQNGF